MNFSEITTQKKFPKINQNNSHSLRFLDIRKKQNLSEERYQYLISNPDYFKEKKHLNPTFSKPNLYPLHTKLIRANDGSLVSNRCCFNEFRLEEQMGMKKRISSLEQQRNSINCVSLGDKLYKSPEHSKNFFCESIVSKFDYNPIVLTDRRTIKKQLGHVEGIFTNIIKNPLMRNKQ